MTFRAVVGEIMSPKMSLESVDALLYIARGN